MSSCACVQWMRKSSPPEFNLLGFRCSLDWFCRCCCWQIFQGRDLQAICEIAKLKSKAINLSIMPVFAFGDALTASNGWERYIWMLSQLINT